MSATHRPTSRRTAPAPRAPAEDAAEAKKRADYEARVDAMLKTLEAPGRTVIWIGPPPFKNERDNDGIAQINEVDKAVVARHTDVVYVDDYALFLGPDGKYADKLPDETGNLVLVRSGDGVHLTDDGARRLAGAVYALVDGQCKTEVQKKLKKPGSADQGTQRQAAGKAKVNTRVAASQRSCGLNTLPTPVSGIGSTGMICTGTAARSGVRSRTKLSNSPGCTLAPGLSCT